MRHDSKKTPTDATDFEREQLRFFLTKTDAASVLAEVNPSLAWLPVIGELNLIENERQLAPWIEKNFADYDAVREIAANIRFFGADTAEILEFRLNRTEGLSPVLMTSWRLIFSHLRGVKRRLLPEWFEIAPRLKRGEHSSDLLERFAQAIRPRLLISKRLSWHEDEKRNPDKPTDLMKIDFGIENDITDEEILSAWPEDSQAYVDEKILRLLTHALRGALEEAIEAGVESDFGYGVSDNDVPSVAKHEQNANRTGFLPIVRVTAELWTRLIRKDTARALRLIELWRVSSFRLIHRLALYASADSLVPAEVVAATLLSVPPLELFLTNSSVEVYRLLELRWSDLSVDQREAIERRIVEGPPPECFREDQERLVNRCRFEFLGHLERNGLELSSDARKILDNIRKRWPSWALNPKERAGFHIWSEGPKDIVGDATKLSGVPDPQLVEAAKKQAAEAGFLEGDTWQALCQNDPGRALRGLTEQGKVGQWPSWAWRPFLWAATKLQDKESVTLIAQLLLESQDESFSEFAADASWWLNEVAKILDERQLWLLWDRIADASMHATEERHYADVVSASLNHPSGNLAGVLLKKLVRGPSDAELPDPFQARLNRLIDAGGAFGRLARVRLAAEVSFLFEIAPAWTKERIIPLFDWSSPDATSVWSARKYTNYIGSPELFELTKEPFLQLFGKANASNEDFRIFSDWLTLIMIVNRYKSRGYPITPVEARSALRQAGDKSLPNVGHRLAVEMASAGPSEKIAKWRNVVGPVFQSIWPLDVELQTSASTFKLVQILLSSGSAFPEAAEVIVPFIQPDDPRHHTTIFAISEAGDLLYSSSPEWMLELIDAVVGDAPTGAAYGLGKSLERIRGHLPSLADGKRYQKLLRFADSP